MRAAANPPTVAANAITKKNRIYIHLLCPLAKLQHFSSSASPTGGSPVNVSATSFTSDSVDLYVGLSIVGLSIVHGLSVDCAKVDTQSGAEFSLICLLSA